jgi:hypothetical protein
VEGAHREGAVAVVAASTPAPSTTNFSTRRREGDGVWRSRRASGRSRVTVGRRCSLEQGSGGHRHVGPRPRYRAVQQNLIQFQISNGFKFFQSLTDPKRIFLSSKF